MATPPKTQDSLPLERVIVELAVPAGSDAGALLAAVRDQCLVMRRVRLLERFISKDGRRATLVFEAPDAEMLRQVWARTVGPETRVRAWTARPE